MTTLEALLIWFVTMIVMLLIFFFVYEPRRIEKEYQERIKRELHGRQ